jgi:hypothetical protein
MGASLGLWLFSPLLSVGSKIDMGKIGTTREVEAMFELQPNHVLLRSICAYDTVQPAHVVNRIYADCSNTWIICLYVPKLIFAPL